MERIDAHQHFWKYDALRQSWITEEMDIIRRDFLPGQLATELKENNIDGTVAVQADQTEEETAFLLELANSNPYIRGVVGWVDLQSNGIADKLASLKSFQKLKGFRHILQSEPDDSFMLRPAFLNGLRELTRHDFTYDLLVFPKHLTQVETLVNKLPQQRFVIDHLAKPQIRDGEINQWEKDIRAIAGNPNVWCKLSGMVTEADWKNWKKEDIYPFIDVVLESFGAKRIMFGSDWPVCLLAASYSQVTGIVHDYFENFSEDEKKEIFGKSASLFYKL